MTPKQLRIERHRAGLCIDCGREVDRPNHYVRFRRLPHPFGAAQLRGGSAGELAASRRYAPPSAFAACRAHYRQLKEEREQGYTLASHGERVRESLRRTSCKHCAYARYNPGGAWFCPLPVCRHEFSPAYREVEL